VTVSVLGPESITIGGINGNYVNGTTSITGYFLLDQLKSTNYYYAISFQLLRENISVYSDYQIMYTFNVSDHLIYSLYNLTDGYYCLNAQLTNDMGTFSKYDTFCFTIEASFVEEVATGTIEIDNTDTEFYVGDTIETDLTLVGLNSNVDYLVEWNWWSSETSSINGNESIESSSSETLSLAPFDSGNAGSYCVNVTLSSDSVSIDTDSWCYNIIEETDSVTPEDDEDGDGVPDEWDECPGSTGTFTDSDGCEPDTEEAVEKAEESGLPGFTAALGLMALIGAAIIARRD
jgi:PGF-CTERM protein